MADNKEVAMLFDSSHCTGCRGCQVACKQWNVLPASLELNANEKNFIRARWISTATPVSS